MTHKYRKYLESMNEISKEYHEATNKFGEFHSPHEGWAIIKEELDELWEEVQAHNTQEMRDEAKQVAAMALRFMVDLTYDEWRGSDKK